LVDDLLEVGVELHNVGVFGHLLFLLGESN
jgi:hypothetical protein